jgi:hypothetical protein
MRCPPNDLAFSCNVGLGGAISDSLDDHVLRVARQCFEIFRIGGQNGSARLSTRDNERIDGRPAASKTSQQSRTTSDRFWDCLHNVAGLEKPILIRITARVALKAFDKND